MTDAKVVTDDDIQDMLIAAIELDAVPTEACVDGQWVDTGDVYYNKDDQQVEIVFSANRSCTVTGVRIKDCAILRALDKYDITINGWSGHKLMLMGDRLVVAFSWSGPKQHRKKLKWWKVSFDWCQLTFQTTVLGMLGADLLLRQETPIIGVPFMIFSGMGYYLSAHMWRKEHGKVS